MVHFSLLKNDDNSTIAVIAQLANSIASYGLMTINSKYAEAGWLANIYRRYIFTAVPRS